MIIAAFHICPTSRVQYSMKKFTPSAFYRTATIVTFLSILERLLGFLYRIVLSQKLGEEILGVYQLANSLFGVFLTIGVGGLPVTVSRFIARFKAEQDPLKEKQTVSAGLLLSLFLSAIPALSFVAFGHLLSPLLPDERCLPVLRILLVGSVFAAAFAVLRGQLWGNKRFLAPTLFELLEESALVLSGVTFLCLGGETPLIERAAWASSLSYALSFSVAFGYFFLQKNKLSSPLPLAKSLLGATLPITATRIANSLLSSAVAVILPTMLMRAGATNAEAMKLFGVLSGMVIPVLFIPATLIGSLSLVLSPQLSEDYYKGNREQLQKNTERGLTAAALLAGLLVPVVFVLGEEIGRIVFTSQTAGEMLKNGSPILLPMSLAMLSTSVLNALGFEKQTFRFYFLGAAALTASILFLPAYVGAYSYLIGMGLNFTVTTVCNLCYLQKHAPLKKSFYRNLFLITASALPVSLFGQLIKSLCAAWLGEFFACVVVGASLFAFAISLYFLSAKKNKKIFSGK